ncbi:MAG TPA: tetratricopeptide repeat protein [Bryobacteraceae bacterium]|nr:tetratricopeptide repeat protein [Bryobacteraceae bacterium]
MISGWKRIILAAVAVVLPSTPQSGAGRPPGYIDSQACAACHPAIYDTYRRTGMGRSFYPLRPENLVEDFRVHNSYYHRASGTHFSMLERGGKYYQRRYQIGFQGQEANVDEKQIDFVMGSGHHVRTYLHRTSAGALLELPLAWYAEQGGYWAMNPGYDKADQPDARRKITYECMFCHNAYPAIPAGHGQLRAEPLFAGELPEGIDCQRCHGPGRRHVEIAQTPRAGAEAIRSAILNPARLSGERQMEVCMQCHLETTSFPLPHSILKFDRGPFSYRAGQPLADFLLSFDKAAADRAGVVKEDRFQIVNSAYRLRMSACFLRSNGALQCTTCHDPHDVPRGDQAALHYNGVCERCHAAIRSAAAAGRHTTSTACVDCHMPKRRTQDVVHAVLTDHYIQRRKKDGDLLAEMPEPGGPAIAYRGEVVPYYPQRLAPTGENQLYLALAQVLENSNAERGIAQFAAAIRKYRPKQAEFYVELAEAERSHGRAADAVPLYEEALRRKPDLRAALHGLGRANDESGQPLKAIQAFRRATVLDPDDALAWQRLGELCVQQGQKTEALAALQKSVALDADAPETHYALGTLWSQPGGDADRAEAAFREAIRLQPDYAQAHLNLAILLFQRGHAEEAGYQFESSIRAKPGYALAHFNYGLMLVSLRRPDEARAQMEAALEADPQFAQAHEELGKLAEMSGRMEDALHEFSEAVQIRPGLARSQLGLGAALVRSGDLAGARKHLDLAAASADPAIRESARRLLSELGN